MKKILILSILLSLFNGCSSELEKADIVVSSYATEYIVKSIVKDELIVKNIIPSGVDIHDFEPTQQDIKMANNVSMVIYIDDHFDEVLAEIDGATGVLDNLENNYDNPHFWLSPKKMIAATDYIYEELLNNYPDMDFENSYQTLKNELVNLDILYEDELKNASKDTFIVSHNSFEHLKDYNIYSIPLADSDHNSDNSQKEILEVINFVEDNSINYIAIEKGTACPNCDVIANEAGITTLEVDSFEFTDESTDFIKIQKENLEVLMKLLN